MEFTDAYEKITAVIYSLFASSQINSMATTAQATSETQDAEATLSSDWLNQTGRVHTMSGGTKYEQFVQDPNTPGTWNNYWSNISQDMPWGPTPPGQQGADEDIQFVLGDFVNIMSQLSLSGISEVMASIASAADASSNAPTSQQISDWMSQAQQDYSILSSQMTTGTSTLDTMAKAEGSAVQQISSNAQSYSGIIDSALTAETSAAQFLQTPMVT